MYITRDTGRLGLVRLAWRALFGGLRDDKDFFALCSQELWIDTRHRRLRVAMDGEVTVMQPPLHYRVRPLSLRVLVPNSLTALYDSVLIPVVTSAGMDHRREALDDEQRAAVEQGVRDIVEDLGTRPAPESKIDADVAVAEHTPPPALAPAWRVYCLPARADRDELAGGMLAHLLREQGFHPENAPAKLVAGDLVKTVEQAGVDAVCISVVAPSTVIHARYLCTKLRTQSRDLKIAVGLWGATENIAGAAQRLRESGADEVVTTLADAVVQLAKLAPPADLQMTAAPIPSSATTATTSSSAPPAPM